MATEDVQKQSGGRKAIYALTGDPLTNGHMWVIETACKLFDVVHIAIGVNPDKAPTFTLPKRYEMITKSTTGLPVVVSSFDGYLVRYAKEMGYNFIIRGIRSTKDFEYEQTLRDVNEDIDPEIETVFLMPPKKLAAISSSMVKGLVGPMGWEEVVARYVPTSVLKELIRWKEKK